MDSRLTLAGITLCGAEESIAYQLHDVLGMMNKDAGVTLHSIRADGGPTRDSFLMQFTADLLGIELHAAAVPDCSALGALTAGMPDVAMNSTPLLPWSLGARPFPEAGDRFLAGCWTLSSLASSTTGPLSPERLTFSATDYHDYQGLCDSSSGH